MSIPKTMKAAVLFGKGDMRLVDEQGFAAHIAVCCVHHHYKRSFVQIEKLRHPLIGGDVHSSLDSGTVGGLDSYRPIIRVVSFLRIGHDCLPFP